MRSRRLLVLSPDLPPTRGGIQTLLGEVVSKLELDWECQTFGRSATGGGRARNRTTTEDGWLSLAELNARGVLFARRADVVLNAHVNSYPAARIARIRWRCPIVSMFYAHETAGFPRLARAAATGSDAAVAVSRYTRGLVHDLGAPPDRVHVINPGIAAPPGTLPARHTGMPPHVVTVARLDGAYKGHDTILEALPAICSSFPEISWDVIGDGPLRSELEARAAELGVAKHVTFHGRVDDDARDALIARADAFLMPSRLAPDGRAGEGFGIVFLEAARLGVPSVAARAGGSVDAVDDGRSGLLVPPSDAAALSAAVIAILSDPALRRRLSEGALEKARASSWEQTARTFDALLSRVSSDVASW